MDRKIAILRMGSIVLFSLALVLCIPPVPSERISSPSFLFAGVAASLIFISGRIVDLRYGITWWQIAFEGAMLALFVFLVFERVQIK